MCCSAWGCKFRGRQMEARVLSTLKSGQMWNRQKDVPSGSNKSSVSVKKGVM